MKLLRYRIKNFRAVIDTGWIDCQPVTAFVGSNESGKTTILMALMKLMDHKREYLSSFKSNIGNLSKIDPKKDIPIDRALEILPVYKETVFIEAVLTADVGLNNLLKELNPQFEPVETIHITKTLGGIYDLPGFLDKFKESQRDEVLQIIISRLPVFLYFKEVTEFKSDINLTELAYKLAGIRKNKMLTPRESVFANLLDYFDIWQSNLIKSICEIYGDINKVSEKEIDFVRIFNEIPLFRKRFSHGFDVLTKEFRRWWGSDDIIIGYEVYKKGVRITLNRDGGKRYLLENRSTGFRRFFALFLSFSVVSRQNYDNTIMLFDEAGAALHPIMQRKLAYFFRELSQNSQILYNTHTSYMLPLTEMNNARIVCKDLDGHINLNSVMQLMADRSNEESLFVAEASLTMHLAKSVIIGCLPIVLLNSEDTYYLQMIKNILVAKGKLNTVYELLIFSAGENGIDSVSELYHADGTLPVIFLPSDEKGREIKSRLSTGMYAEDTQKLFEMTDFTVRTPRFYKRTHLVDNADCFEDLIPPKFIERFGTERLSKILGAEFVYDRTKPLISQIEEYASAHEITLPRTYRADIARSMKICMMMQYKDMHIPSRYIRVWKKMFKTLLKDHNKPEFEFTADTVDLPDSLVWHSYYEIGVKIIDEQHKEIFTQFNAIHSAIASNNDLDKVKEIFEFLIEYVGRHFHDEEAVMIDANYTGYARHKLLHDNFKTNVGYLMQAYKEQGATRNISIQLHNMLAKWIVTHIEREDKNIGYFLHAEGQKYFEGEPDIPKDAILAMRAEKGQMFTLSRHDILDHVEEMRANTLRFPVATDAKLRTDDNGSDYLRCGENSFCIMHGLADIVYNLTLRMSRPMVNACLASKHSVSQQPFMRGSDWYMLSVDRSFTKKKQIYDLLDESYDYVLRAGEKSAAAAKGNATEQQSMEEKVAENIDIIAMAAAEAEKRHAEELLEFKSDYSTFTITRADIADRMMTLSLDTEDDNIIIVQRPKQLQLPMSLKYEGKTFALLYGTEEGVLMVVRLDKEYADELAPDHPEIHRVHFPSGAHWYYLPIDGAFHNEASVYAVLDRAMNFIRQNKSATQAKTRKKSEKSEKKQPHSSNLEMKK